jgi:hypothetical protein
MRPTPPKGLSGGDVDDEQVCACFRADLIYQWTVTMMMGDDRRGVSMWPTASMMMVMMTIEPDLESGRLGLRTVVGDDDDDDHDDRKSILLLKEQATSSLISMWP